MKHTCVFIPSFVAFIVVMALAIGASGQTESVLYSFSGGSDGVSSYAGLIFDGNGNLYGTTTGGGTNSTGCSGCGTVFELSPSSSGTWSEKLLYTFGALFSDGASPYGPLVFDKKGNLFGTTISGGSAGYGTVFELTPGSSGTWTESVLYSFSNGKDGGIPFFGLVLDSAGNLYGTTESGGLYGFGTVFELIAGTTGTWTEKVLHSFTGGNDGATPVGGLVFDSVGNLYGLTISGGLHDYGVAFKLTHSSTGNWSAKAIYSFPSGAGGSSPSGNLIFDSTGNLYGTATYIVFELSPNSSGTWTAKTLHNFAGGSDGATAMTGLIFDKAGSLYGTTDTGGYHRGTVFKLTPASDGTWTETILHRFSASGGDGIFPTYGSLVIDAAGHLYGTTPQGGASNNGIVFEVTP